jgi:hypothetical protein
MLGHTIEVVVDNEYCHNNNCLGIFLALENKIIISDRYKTNKSWRKYKSSIVEHTFYHELTHCILYHTGHGKLWLNEMLVDAVGGLYLQFERSKKC